MTTTKKRIAIIGGGFSGCGSVGILKDEGLEPVCFEATDIPGGMWYYREKSVIGQSSIMPTTTLINSKEISAVSYIPPKKEYSNYMRHSEVYQYFLDCYKYLDIERYIRFNTEVINIKKSEDYDQTGCFVVTYKDKITGKISGEIFDGVVVGTGQFTVPNIISFPGLDKFKGMTIHTHSLKCAEDFKGKNVLIIGNGPSGLDAADFISSVCKQVYLSSRSGMFVISRLGPNGYPIDYVLLRRYLNILLEYLPKNLVSWFIETFYLDTKFDHRLYNVRPKYHMFSKDPIVNDAIFSKLLSGTVIQKGQVKCFVENGVIFDGEENVTEIDSVIMATGYKLNYPYLDDGLFEIVEGRLNLYKCVFPVQLPHPTLAFIGLVHPFGPGVPIGEMQCRWVAHVFSGKGELPPRKVMLKECIQMHQENESRYTPSEYMTVRVDFLHYLDDIASQIGAKPNILKYIFTDFPLFLKLVFGPSLPYQYRLEGPHKWEGARDAIMTCRERVLYPLTKGKDVKKSFVQLLIEFLINLIPRNIFF